MVVDGLDTAETGADLLGAMVGARVDELKRLGCAEGVMYEPVLFIPIPIGGGEAVVVGASIPKRLLLA